MFVFVFFVVYGPAHASVHAIIAAIAKCICFYVFGPVCARVCLSAISLQPLPNDICLCVWAYMCKCASVSHSIIAAIASFMFVYVVCV
jgi:hypothetical protein